MSMKLRSIFKPLALLAALGAAGLCSSVQAQPAPAASRAQAPAVRDTTPVTLNFVNADIESVARAMGVMTKRQILVDPRVKGQITLSSDQPMSVHEAYLQFLAQLRGLSYTVVDSAGLLKVVPEADAKLQAAPVQVERSGIHGDQIITQVFTIGFENANNLVAVLRPLISPNNTINANPGNNTLVITDYADNLQRIAKIIAALDVPGASGVEVVPLKNAVAADIAPLVQKLADGSSAATVPGTPGGSSSVLADPRGNALVLRAGSAAKLAALKQIVAQLDQPLGSSGSNIHVVYLKNADAVKLATVLRAAFGGGQGGGGSGSTGATSGGTTTQGNFGGTNTGLNSPPGTGGSGTGSGLGATSSAATSPVAASANPSTGGFVQADPATNSLIITAAEPMYRQVRNVIEQLDGRRAQVYVESMIVKVDVSKAAQIGVQWQNLFGSTAGTATGVGTNFGTGLANIITGTAATAGGVTGVSTALSSSSANVPAGLNLAVFKKIGSVFTLGALANFLQTQSGANVLSTPTLVALDNEEAKIVIGQNVPFVTGSFTNTGASGSTVNPFTTVERQDVGLTLRVKSQIGENGTIRMTIYEENSSVTTGTASNANGPTTDKSAVETTVVVDDGSTLVLGGLMKDEYGDADDGVPGLASIPLIGNLFKNQNRTRTKTNLLVFLHPVVLRDQAAADQISMDRYEAIRAIQGQAPQTHSAILPETGNPVIDPLQPPKAVTRPVTPPAQTTPPSPSQQP
ncbi:MAG: type II secretion system secretin GspD [Pelomonas sp.]|nr:type II secretion system secretin GspD [Roseateles sp.]